MGPILEGSNKQMYGKSSSLNSALFGLVFVITPGPFKGTAGMVQEKGAFGILFFFGAGIS